MRPRAVSICGSMPTRLFRPVVSSIWVRSMSSAFTSAADCTLGSMISSSRSDEFSTTWMTSRYVHFVSHALTRTQSTVSPQSRSLIAFTTLSRAASFSSGATASSRSRKTMSAPRLGALPSIFSLDPGTERQERRGRLRERSDMLWKGSYTLGAWRNPLRPARCTSSRTACTSGSSPAASPA